MIRCFINIKRTNASRSLIALSMQRKKDKGITGFFKTLSKKNSHGAVLQGSSTDDMTTSNEEIASVYAGKLAAGPYCSQSPPQRTHAKQANRVWKKFSCPPAIKYATKTLS